MWFDLMTQVLGVSFEECFADNLLLQFADVPVRYIGLAAPGDEQASGRRRPARP
ncbi:MAG: hypothetical protein WKG07_38180 [Hymenobacter sp.]